jgi:hypothetical protein
VSKERIPTLALDTHPSPFTPTPPTIIHGHIMVHIQPDTTIRSRELVLNSGEKSGDFLIQDPVILFGAHKKKNIQPTIIGPHPISTNHALRAI